MSPKILLVLGLITLCYVVEATSFLKKLHHKELASPFVTEQFGGKAVKSLLRKRRETDTNESSSSLTSSEEDEFLDMMLELRKQSKQSVEDTNTDKFLFGMGWEHNKLELLTSFIEDMAKSDTNLTLVGWQRIYGPDGKLHQVETVQLVIPPKPTDRWLYNSAASVDDSESNEDKKVLPQEQIKEMREMFEAMEELGITPSMSVEEFDSEGNKKVLLYMDKDQLYVKSEGFAIYNKTAIVSPQEADDFVQHFKPSLVGEPTVLKYDVDDNLIFDQSKINPLIMGGVTDFYETPDDILLSGPEIISKIALQYPKAEIPKQLALYYNKAYPDYRWGVLINPDNFWITRDVAITLSFDNANLFEDNKISYYVYGVKKSNSTNKK